jgi:hypothetical protein
MPEHPKNTPLADPSKTDLTSATLPATTTVGGEGAAIGLYRGRWIEPPLTHDQVVATGGSIFSEELTLKIRLDLASFNGELATWTKPNVEEKILEKRGQIAEQLAKAGINLDAEIVLIALFVQNKTDALLQVIPDHNPGVTRIRKYSEDGIPPSLSEFRGISACAERAILAKHLCDLIGVPATYMSGVTAQVGPQGNITDEIDHSFLVMPHNGSSIVFDVARKCGSGWPRLVVMDHEMSLERFLSAQNILISGTCPFSSANGKILFGVGNPMSSEPLRVLGE